MRELTVFWIINRHRDSMSFYIPFGKVPTDVPIHVCRNLYFDKTQRFEIYHTSNAREPVEKMV